MIHHYDPELAARLGINQAIVLYNLAYLQTQRALQGGDDYFFEGRWWVRHSYESLAEWHKYLSVPQMKRVMKQLIEAGHVVTRHPEHFNRTTYWSVAPEFLHSAESDDARCESDSSEGTKSYDVLHDNNIKTLYSKRCTNLDDFEINDHLREWAKQKDYKGLHAHAEKFINYCLNNPKKYKDYNAAFRNWVINGEERKKNGGKWS